MSSPISEPASFEFSKILLQLLGAGLSIFGGFAALFLRSRIEKKEEVSYIKISITDELHEICDTIKRLKETYQKSKLVSNDYLNELNKNTESYTFHKQRLFNINSQDLRKEITDFYKFLSNILDETRNRVGSLGEKIDGDTGSHDNTIASLTEVSAKAEALSIKLKKYKYRLFWFNR